MQIRSSMPIKAYPEPIWFQFLFGGPIIKNSNENDIVERTRSICNRNKAIFLLKPNKKP